MLWRRLVMLHRRQGRRMMGCLRRMVVFVSPPMIFMPVQRGLSAPYWHWRRRCSDNGGTRSGTGRGFSIVRGRPLVVEISQPASSITICSHLLHWFIIVIRLVHTLETTSRGSVFPLTRCSFSSSERGCWRGRTSKNPPGLRRVSLMLVMIGVAWPR